MTTMQPAQLQTVNWTVYRTLVGIGLICALVIVTVFESTSPIININKKRALERAVYRVLPHALSFTAYTLDSDNTLKKAADNNTPKVYACYNAHRELIGFAIPAHGMGYQDTIQLLYGYSTQSRSIEGMVILQSRETPGLGSKIEENGFLGNFRRINISLTPGAGQLEHPLELIKNIPKSHDWQIDAVTGATVSSQAVVAILNRSLGFWTPLIAKQQERFQLEH